MADDERGPDREKYEAPTVRELGAMDDLTSGEDSVQVTTLT